MIHALDRLRQLATGAVAALLVTALVVVVSQGFDEGALTSADAPSADAPGDSARSGSWPSPEAANGPEVGEAPTQTADGASDLALVSQDVVLTSSGSAGPAAATAAGTSPRVPSAPASTTPTSPVPVTPTTPPTSPPVTPPTPPTTPGPTAPTTPTTPAPPASKPAVVNVGVLSGGQLLSVDVNLAAPNLVNLSLLQP